MKKTLLITGIVFAFVLAGGTAWYYQSKASADTISTQSTKIQIVDQNGKAIADTVNLNLTLAGIYPECSKQLFGRSARCRISSPLVTKTVTTDANGQFVLSPDIVNDLSSTNINDSMQTVFQELYGTSSYLTADQIAAAKAELARISRSNDHKSSVADLTKLFNNLNNSIRTSARTATTTTNTATPNASFAAQRAAMAGVNRVLPTSFRSGEFKLQNISISVSSDKYFGVPVIVSFLSDHYQGNANLVVYPKTVSAIGSSTPTTSTTTSTTTTTGTAN